MRKLLLIFCLSVTITFVANAQYSTAFGLRYNGGVGLSVKQNLRSNNALEGILTGYNSGINLTLLYEKHQSAFNSSNWRWYLGTGGHIGSWRGAYKGEHTFDEIPLNISIDWKPSVNLVPNPDLGIRNIGLSGRINLK